MTCGDRGTPFAVVKRAPHIRLVNDWLISLAVIDHSSSDRALEELSALAQAEGISVYDAAYLDLSIRLKMPLACKGGSLATAASHHRVRVKP